MKVCGYNSLFQLGEQANNKSPNGSPIISPYCISHLNISELISFSSYGDNSIWVLANNEAYAFGSNCFGQISVLIPKKTLLKDTKILIRDKEGIPCKFISAVCGEFYTLYQISSDQNESNAQLVYTYRYKTPLFLNINGRVPKTLYGGKETAAAINDDGSVSIITKSVLTSPRNSIEPIYLPENDRAVKVACLNDSVLALGFSGRLFEYPLNYPGRQFVEVKELQGQKFDDVSGSLFHCFAVCKNGRVFGRGMNDCGQLGLKKTIRSVKKFTLIESLKKQKVVETVCGCSHSIFVTIEGKIFTCGKNYYGELMLKSGPSKENVYVPTDTSLQGKKPFCIAGCCTSFVLMDVDVPKNCPNKKIVEKVDDAVDEEEDENKTLTEIFDLSINESFGNDKNCDDSKNAVSSISELKDYNKKESIVTQINNKNEIISNNNDETTNKNTIDNNTNKNSINSNTSKNAINNNTSKETINSNTSKNTINNSTNKNSINSNTSKNAINNNTSKSSINSKASRNRNRNRSSINKRIIDSNRNKTAINKSTIVNTRKNATNTNLHKELVSKNRNKNMNDNHSIENDEYKNSIASKKSITSINKAKNVNKVVENKNTNINDEKEIEGIVINAAILDNNDNENDHHTNNFTERTNENNNVNDDVKKSTNKNEINDENDNSDSFIDNAIKNEINDSNNNVIDNFTENTNKSENKDESDLNDNSINESTFNNDDNTNENINKNDNNHNVSDGSDSFIDDAIKNEVNNLNENANKNDFNNNISDDADILTGNDTEDKYSQIDSENQKLKEELETAKKAISTLHLKERENSILKLELALTKRKIALLQKNQENSSVSDNSDKK